MATPLPRCLALGEALLRLRVSAGQRLHDVHRFEVAVGGAELNAMIAAAQTGIDTTFVTKLPVGPLGERVIRHARQHGVAVAGPRQPGGRLGTYYVEAGPAPRGTEVIYDRAGSAFAHLEPGELQLDALLGDVDHVHVTGITFALGDGAAKAALALLEEATNRDIPVSYDINYRAKLWDLVQARASTQRVMEHVTTLFASPHDLTAFFDADGDTTEAAARVREAFDLERVVVSEREAYGPGRTRCRVTIVGAHVDRSRWVEAEVIDPIGAGDALAGVALGELLQGQAQEVAAARAVAAAAIQQTLLGDPLIVERDELSLPGIDRQVRR